MTHFTKPLHCVSLFCLLLTSACKKNNDGLPPLTLEGKNTIGCKIDGKAWIPMGIYDFSGVQYPTSGGYYGTFSEPLIHIWLKTNDPSIKIELFIKNVDKYNYLPPGKYVCNQPTHSLPFGSGIKFTYGLLWTNNREYITDNLHTGWIELLKSDTVNKIVSGRFEFDAYNSAEGKTYHITDGRFDYRTH